MARTPLRRLLQGSLALPGALWGALRPRPPAAPPAAPLLPRLRALFTAVADDEVGPVTATYSEVRLYGTPRRADADRGLVRTIDVPAPDAVAHDFAQAKEQLARRLAQLGGTARAVALEVAARLEADLAALEVGVAEARLPPRSKRRRKRAVARLERMLEVARAVEVDPTRGRRRDLKRLSTAVRSLRTLAGETGGPHRRSRRLRP